jgi:chromosome partitioning protein
MASIIGLLQIKGGAGRSTLATNLAGELAKKSKVLLIDCDMPQGTSASWAAMREANDLTATYAMDHSELLTKIEQHQGDYDFIVLDGAPRSNELTRAMLIMADLSLIPVGASAAEVWATSDMLPIIEQAQEIKPDLLVRLVWTRYRAYTNAAKEISKAAGKELGLKSLRSKIGYRVAYSDSLARGLTVSESTDKTAKAELEAMAREVRSLMT